MPRKSIFDEIFQVAKQLNKFKIVDQKVLRSVINKKYGNLSDTKLIYMKFLLEQEVQEEQEYYTNKKKLKEKLRKKEEKGRKSDLEIIEQYLDAL